MQMKLSRRGLLAGLFAGAVATAADAQVVGRVTSALDHVPGYGELIQFEIMGPSGLPASAGNINGNGVIARARFKGMPTGLAVDTSKGGFIVARPGWNTSKVYSAKNVQDDLIFMGDQRQPAPNASLRIATATGFDVDVYFAISDDVFKLDTVMSVTLAANFYGKSKPITFLAGKNSSTLAYPMPQVSPLAQRYWERMTSSGIDVEYIVDHKFARNKQTVAVVEPYIRVGATEYGSVAINAMTASAKVTTPFAVPCYAGTIPQASCPQGECFMDARIYPWVGDAIWDTQSFGEARPTFNLPSGWPANCDTDGSYAPAGAYVSHTGVQIGTPSIKPLGSLGSYATEGAYATAKDLAAAGKTYNNSGSRARPHNDIAEIYALAGNGHLIDGLGAAMSNTTTYPPGLGFFTLGREAGSTKSTTGWTTTTTTGTTIKVPPTRFRCTDIALVGGGAGQLQCLFRGAAAAGNSGTALAEAALQYVVLDNCVGTGANDNGNAAMIQQGGHRVFINNAFNDQGDDFLSVSNAGFAGQCILHGGTYDNGTNATPGGGGAWSVIGVRLKQFSCGFDSNSSVRPETIGPLMWNTDVSVDNASTTVIGSPNYQSTPSLSHPERGASVLGFSVKMTHNTQPGFDMSADFSGNDRPAIKNINLRHISVAGGRANMLYNEFTASQIEKRTDMRFCAFSQKNSKADDSTAATSVNGARTGIMAYKYGTGVRGVVSGDSSANGVYPPTIGGGSWLGEVTPRDGADNVGQANLFTTDTSNNTGGSNDPTTPMNWAPLAALKNRVAAGYAVVPIDRNGTTYKNDSTDAAGCENY